MKTLLALILLIGLAVGGYWYLTKDGKNENLERTKDDAVRRTEDLARSAKDKLKEVSSNAPEIKEDIKRGSEVVRQKAQEVGAVIADATADARTTAAIKAKLVKDPNLSALRISVNTTGAVVTLSGSVDSADEVKQAIKLAMDTDGVREAISTLQVKAAK